MAKKNEESITEVLHELDKNQFIKQALASWLVQSKKKMWTTLAVVSAILVTVLLLNWGGKLSMESNGWILAALIGYLFGRGTQ